MVVIILLVLFSLSTHITASEWFENSIGMKMIPISKGTFQMGRVTDNGQFDEYPLHRVHLTRDFFISETEVTVEQYRQFKPEFEGFNEYAPYTTGMSWFEAEAFCCWLSEREGKTYRLPTEAEWEYVCRAGSQSPYSSGDIIPDHETANPWGVRNMHTGPLEWCYDWYGDYPLEEQKDPIGLECSFSKVIRGGLPDEQTKIYNHPFDYYARSSNRASMAPAFASFQNQVESRSQDQYAIDQQRERSGLIGILFDDAELKKPMEFWTIEVLNSDRLKWPNLGDFSALWIGKITAPYTGLATIDVEVDAGIRVFIDGQSVIDGWNTNGQRIAQFLFKGGKNYPLEIHYLKQKKRPSYMRFFWTWPGRQREPIPAQSLSFNPVDSANVELRFSQLLASTVKPSHIGFRVVQAELPATSALPRETPFHMSGVRQKMEASNFRSITNPYFRKRFLLPIPPENTDKNLSRSAGIDSYLSGHNHSPGLMALPNGDLLFVFFTATYEDEPEAALAATRLRYGSDQWDFPSRFVNFADVNDVSPLCWNDNGTLWLFFGNIHLNGRYPFQWLNSKDNGASWSAVQFPRFNGKIGPYSSQPITSAFRDENGTIYFGLDGLGSTSFLMVSNDEGRTWFDSKGRTGGRHTTFVRVNNDEIAGYGGKRSEIDGYMPVSLSNDKGRTWMISKSIFPALDSGQRPALIRLISGNLLLASDFQRDDGFQPPGVSQRGSFVALSQDEGKTWLIKKIPSGHEHAREDKRKGMQGETLGYASLTQTPNGMIHLATTMTHPALHFEFNEQWILSANQDDWDDQELMQSRTEQIHDLKVYQEFHESGDVRLEYHAGMGDDDRFLLHGEETWYYENGKKQYQANYHLGKKTGTEIYWDVNGLPVWEWRHRPDGFSEWTQWWPNGSKKSHSFWQGQKCHGRALTWDPEGKLISDVFFHEGMITNKE